MNTSEASPFCYGKDIKSLLVIIKHLIVFLTFPVLDTPIKIETTAQLGKDKTDSINVVILSLNDSVEDVFNEGITKQLIVSFWKALGENKSNLLWADVNVSCIKLLGLNTFKFMLIFVYRKSLDMELVLGSDPCHL